MSAVLEYGDAILDDVPKTFKTGVKTVLIAEDEADE